MGGTQSVLGGPKMTRQQLLQSTSNNRVFINDLFRVMIAKLTPADILKLGNSHNCTQYVFMMADSIQKLFDDLRIRPAKAKDSGLILFQKVETLKKTGQSRDLCLHIAYYFIRIFQIFGALALSVIDDESAGSILGAQYYAAPIEQLPRRGVGYLGRGGASFEDVRLNFSSFKSIASLLNDSVVNIQGKNALEFKYIPNVYITQLYGSKNLYISIDNSIAVWATMSFTEPIRSIQRKLQEYTMKISNFEILDKRNKSTEDLRLIENINRKLKSLPVKSISYSKYQIEDDDFYKKDNTAYSLTDTIQNYINYVKNIVEEIIRNPEKTVEQLGIVKRGATQQEQRMGVSDMVGVKDSLKTEYIIKILGDLSGTGKGKSASFCVARALQLLDAKTQFTPKSTQGSSSICFARSESLPFSVPEVGKSISTVAGIFTLNQLYYDKASISKDGTFDLQPNDEYVKFLEEMNKLFGAKSLPADKPTISSVIAKPTECIKDYMNKYLRITDPRAINAILQIIGQMYNRQFKHTQAVIQFIKTRLIVLGKKGPGSVELQPRLNIGDLNELAKISAEARALLINYYKDCEGMYQQGIRQILASNPKP